MNGEARIVNYAGIVRGGSQKLFKMEMYAYFTNKNLDLKKRDNLTARLDNIIDCLIDGGLVESDQKVLIKLGDPIFEANMKRIRESFDRIKEEISLVRAGKAPDEFYSLTEIYFELCNETVGDSENFSQKQVNKNLTLLIFVNFLLLIILILAGVNVITARKNKAKAEALSEVAQNAERESRAKSSFLANMSHEIRTPLNAIIGMSAIADRSADENQISKCIKDIRMASEHLLNIVNDILDISKIESGKFEIGKESFNLKQAFDEVGSMFQARCDSNDLIFNDTVEIDESIWVNGDKPRFKQVMINLLANAVKFTPKGGEVVFSGSVSKSGETLICDVSVKDTGIGMNEAQVKKLFAPFEQAGVNVSLKYGGTGLGLAISRNIVNLMGGEIHVKSQPEKGSEFSFNVIFEEALPADFNETEYEFPDLTGKRMLLVDDIEINRHIVTAILDSTHIEIIEAADGTQAVKMIAESPEGYFDIIFLDTRMPHMDGYEAARQIRALDRTDSVSIPIISMSANAFSDDIKAALAAGMNDYLTKPVAINKLAEILTKYII
jgi:signal transduction histidine kinase/ActR/RegA family two-component response regulator